MGNNVDVARPLYKGNAALVTELVSYQDLLKEQHYACLSEVTAASSDPLGSQTGNFGFLVYPSQTVW